MTIPTSYKSNLILVVLLAAVATAVSAFAYSDPTSPFPANTAEPIDIGAANQAKAGGLSVNEFHARGNADLQQDATFVGAIQGGSPGNSPTTVNVTTNTLVSGEVYADDYLNSTTLTHGAPQPKPLCGDAVGNIVFC